MENNNIKNVYDKYMKDFNKWFNNCVIIPVHSNPIHMFKDYYKNSKESKEFYVTFKEPFFKNDIIEISKHVTDKIDKQCTNVFIKNRNNNICDKPLTFNYLTKAIKEICNPYSWKKNNSISISYQVVRTIYNHFKNSNPNLTEKDIIDNLKKGNSEFFRSLEK